jgi:hypothetical protein
VLLVAGIGPPTVRAQSDFESNTPTSHDQAIIRHAKAFVLITAAAINRRDPQVVHNFSLNAIDIFGGAGLYETAEDFLAHRAVDMTIYPDTLRVSLTKDGPVVQLTYSGLVSPIAIATYLWYLKPKGKSYVVDQTEFQQLVPADHTSVSEYVELDMQPDGISLSQQYFRHTDVIRFDVINNIPDGSLRPGFFPYTFVYRVHNLDQTRLDMQNQLHWVGYRYLAPIGFDYVVSLSAPTGAEGFSAIMLPPGTYVLQGMSVSSDSIEPVDGISYITIMTIQ